MADFNLEVRGLGAAYGRHVVLKNVSLRLPAGEWFALMGPNGCGKSTLLDCIVGKLAPVSGHIQIAGHPLLTDTASAKRVLGYACAPDKLPPLLPHDNASRCTPERRVNRRSTILSWRLRRS
jgi:ABC-type multidrug transport system ATPase subunit